MDRVQVIKRESAAQGGDGADDVDYLAPIEPQEDAIEAAGLYLQSLTDRDTAVLVSRDVNDNLTFTDPVTGTKTLAQLSVAASGVSYNEFLLTNPPTAETGTPDCTYTPTYVAGLITLEAYRRSDSTLVKTVDYTYTARKVTSKIVKVFAANGTTIVAQLTWTIVYTGNIVTSETATRDV
jgi:hypothetical protein